MPEGVMAILTPEGAPLTDPAQVERALAALWKPPPNEAGEDALTRVCVGNLLVVGRSSDWDHLARSLGALSPLYPSRTIGLLVDDQTPAGDVRAAVSAFCYVPRSGRRQVCCEQIVLRGRPREADDFHRTLLPLLDGEVPTMCWWTLDPALYAALFDVAGTLGDRLILDCGLGGLRHLGPAGNCAVRELGWYRTARWRDLAASMFDVTAPRVPAAIDRVEIEMAGPSDVDRVDAVWLIAFLAGQLDWQQTRVDMPNFVEFRAGDRSVTVAFRFGQGSRAGLRSLRIRAGDNQYDMVGLPAGTGQYRLTECDANICQLPRCVHAAPLAAADALALAFNGRRCDLAFSRAAPIAARLA